MRRKSNRSRASKGSSRRSARVSPIALPLQPIKCCHTIEPKEKLFLEAAERGDKHSIVRCLQPPNPVNVNCTNMLGRSAIQIAVDNENVEIVEVLLKQDGVKIGDALLYAIREGVYKIVEMLIDHPSITPVMLGADWAKSKCVQEIGEPEESNDYSPDISPVILAAHCNQFEILQLLLLRGALIDRPHQLSCSCRKCQERVYEDGLRHSLRRINTYRALASPAWISLTSSDPILSAFRLSWELKKLALRENEFKDTYLELSSQCKQYACDLLDQCRSTDEVIAVLNKDSDSDSDDDDDEDDKEPGKLTLSRLKLALKYQQKEFVAHPNCQQLLTSIWYEGLPSWRKRNAVSKLFMCVGLILLMPFMAMYYWVFPLSRIGLLLRSPFMKFLYHSASFGVFLILLICASTEVSSLTNREKLRGPPPTELEWMICIWVTGFIWAECKQLWEEGLKAYITQWWNWLDFIMLSLYMTTLTLRFVAYFQIESGRYGPREMDRQHWPLLDPTMVSEALFAIANVFSFARIIYLFQADQYLGPLQISLGCMLIDIAKFLFIFFLVMTSFACGLNQLYWYYNPSSDGNPSAFYTLEASYRTLYWSLFSLTQLKDIKIEGGQYFTENVGEMLFMAYHCMAVIVLIHMLIAMMSNSFQEIETRFHLDAELASAMFQKFLDKRQEAAVYINHADMEWKFSRSKLWMGYFDEGSTLPTPFNIIISPKAIIYFFKAIGDTFCSCCPTLTSIRRRKRQRSVDGSLKNPQNGELKVFARPVFNGDIPNHVHVSKRHITDIRYQDIMRRLVSRYIHQTKKQRRQAGVNEDDLLEIKQDISSLRYEIREDRVRESYHSEKRLDSLRTDLMGALRGGHTKLKSTHNPSKVHLTHSYSGEHPPSYACPPSYRSDINAKDDLHFNPSLYKGDLNLTTAQNKDTYGKATNNGAYSDKITENLSQFPIGRPALYSTAKVQSYISHLDNYSSTATDNQSVASSTVYQHPSYYSKPEDSLPQRTGREHRGPVYTGSKTDAILNRTNSRVLSVDDIETIKLEILTSLKAEICDTAKEVAADVLTQARGAEMMPELNSELYQTHLYTQL